MTRVRSWVPLCLALLGCRDTPYRTIEVEANARSNPAVAGPESGEALRFSVAAIQAPATTFLPYSRLFARLSARIGREIQLVERRTYREVDDLLIEGKLDVAFICTGGLLDLEERAPGTVEVIAVPRHARSATFRSFVIVGAASPAHRLEDLEGVRFAFTDDLSLTGYLYPVRRLRDLGSTPARFFASTVFTHGHERSVRAVARGVVDAAAVSDLVFEAMSASPGIMGEVRVIERSPPFGAPPVVVSARLSPVLKAGIRDALLELGDDPESVAILRELGSERFVAPSPGLYESAHLLVPSRP